MIRWDSIWKAGRRASDLRPSPPEPRVRDWVLERSIDLEQFEVLFQPMIEPATARVAGVEALARCSIAPSATELFARAERAGLAERLSRVVQRKALRAAAAWEGPLRNLRLSLNLLPQEIARAGYDHWLLNVVADLDLDPSRLTVEITENALLSSDEEVAGRLARLRDAGVKIALDDFGTGYASLAYLTTLPLDLIKIDRGLITDIVGGSRDRIVVKALIRLARELDLGVVVEGVESSAQLSLLAEWGCDLYQGFLGAGALTDAELSRFVAQTSNQAA